jgi:soluble lytic murein transglycosylase
MTSAPAQIFNPQRAAFDEARALLADGDYDAAGERLAALLNADPHGPLAREVRLALAESFALRDRWGSAAEAARPLVDSALQDAIFARALFLLARSHEVAGAHAEASASFARYQALGTPLAPYAQLRQAAQDEARGALAEAAAGYEAAASSEMVNGERAGALLKAAAAQRALGQPGEALRLYRVLLAAPPQNGLPALADPPAFRAQTFVEAAATAIEAGDPTQARAWLREAVAVAPAAPAALEAVNQLLADQQSEIEPVVAATVLLAHERPADALPHLEAAIALAQGEAQIELRRLRGLALRDLGSYDAALQELAAAGAALPDSQPGRQAQLDWVQTIGQSGDVPRAVQGYREFAAAYPSDERAPEALSRAALLLERGGDAEGAVQQQLDLGARYPQAVQTPAALAAAGRYLFLAGRFAEARGAWERLTTSAEPITSARGAYWAGRAAQQAGDAASARAWFEQARTTAPDSYYAARSTEQLGAPQPTGAVLIGAPLTADDWAAIDAWMASWTGTAAGEQLDLTAIPAVARAVALAEVGLRVEAVAEWRALLEICRDEPAKLRALAQLAHEQDQPYVALLAADRLARLSPGGTSAAPLALRRLIYPTPYRALVLARSAEFGVDPMALYALLRQESLFNASATSWVGARGLAQVMPATGEGIAQNLGITGYRSQDLYRPAVSVRFGAYYLGQQIGNMSGSLPGALAAYNGGLGNARRWAGGSVVADQDLFAEGIDFRETREYVKLVYGFQAVYRGIYQQEELP